VDDVPSKKVVVFSGNCSQGDVVELSNDCFDSEEVFYGTPISCIDGVVAKPGTIHNLKPSQLAQLIDLLVTGLLLKNCCS
jgi:hypothetical protein